MIAGLGLLVFYLPEIRDEDKLKLFVNFKDLSKLRIMAETLARYAKFHNLYVFGLFVYVYVFMQTFAIPGPLILSILSGAIWGLFKGFWITSFCATLGSACCYTLSSVFLEEFVERKWPQKVALFKQTVSR